MKNRNSILKSMICLALCIVLGSCSAAESATFVAGALENKFHIVVNRNGTIRVLGEPDNSYDFENWKDIKNVTIGFYYAAAVKNDGTVLITGDHDPEVVKSVSQWRNIIMIRFTFEAVFGLRQDGTIVYTGTDRNDLSLFKQVNQWTDIIYIDTSVGSIVGVNRNGNVIGAGLDQENEDEIKNWHNVNMVSVSMDKVVGLTNNNEILFADFKGFSRPYEEIKGAVKVCTGNTYVAALMPDGSIRIKYTDYPGWPSIKSDTVDITQEMYAEIQDYLPDSLKKLNDMTDVNDISINFEYLSILKKDGSVLSG